MASMDLAEGGQSGSCSEPRNLPATGRVERSRAAAGHAAMDLEPEQERVLRGASGEAMALAMRTLVRYGEACGARRLVPIRSAHLAGSFGIILLDAYCRILERLVADGLRVVVPTTTNPRPGTGCGAFNRIVYAKQFRLDRALDALGVTPSYSCTCYEQENVPSFGDRIAWSESSAVQYANSVIGARTNRNSILIDICSAVTGLTPEFGCLLDERRRGQVLVKLEADRVDPSALGFIVGRKLVDRVPVFEHRDFRPEELKQIGAGLATSSGIDLFHVVGVTPEAPDLDTAFGGGPRESLTVSQQDLDSLRGDGGSPDGDLVVFGCPHLSLEEAVALADHFRGKKVRLPTWFCLGPDAAERFERTEACRAVRRAGVRIHTCCPLAALTVRPGSRRILTPAAKLSYYLEGSGYGNLEDCLNACLANP